MFEITVKKLYNRRMAQVSFQQILTMVLLMAFGVVCRKSKLIDENANQKISGLVMYIINPLVVFLSYLRPLTDEVKSGLFIALGLSFLSFFIAILVSHIIYKKKENKNRSVLILAAVYPNCGFIGIPLIRGIYGDDGVFYLTAYLTAFTILLWTHGISIIKEKRIVSLKKAALSPGIIAVVLGFIFFTFELSMPLFLARPLNILADTNTPLAMLVAGATIANTNIKRVIKDIRVYKTCFIRLLFIPALFLLALRLFNTPDIIKDTLVVAAACPMGASSVLFAVRYNKDSVFASELFAATTVFAMLSIPLFVLIM